MKKLISLFVFALTLTGCSLFRGAPAPLEPVQITLKTAKQPLQGYDALGLAMYCSQYLKAPPLPAVSTLLNTFGDPLSCIEKRIQQGGLELVEVDLRDATCWRNRVCPPGTPSLTDWGVMLQRAKQVNQLAVKYPQIRWWVSPYLEHDFKDSKVIEKACQVALKGCPSCKCINTPTNGSARPAGIPLELHGSTVRAFAVSSDGASMFDADNIASDGNGFEHRTAGREVTFGWFPSLNLRCSGEHAFVMPLKRTEKPTADEFRQAYQLMQPEPQTPAAPPQCRSVRGIIRGREINKTNAERYCNGVKDDGRGNKPLLIVQIPGRKGQRMPVWSPSGKQVAAFCYYGTYTPMKGAHRWYMGNCTGETPTQLFNELGSESGFAEYAPGKCLRFNALRREGIYR